MVSFCEQFDNLTKWKLLSYSKKEALLKQKQQELLCFLEKDAAFTGRFAVIAMQRLQNIAETLVRIAEEKELQIGKVVRAGRLRHLSEKAFQKIELESHIEAERKDLSESIDGSLISFE